jgi:hypothetical protein
MKLNSYKIIRYFTAIVWLINGIYAKILGGIPRHELIVEKVLQTTHAHQFIIWIGIAEIFMVVWILSGKYSKFNVIVQAIVILTMNILEFTLSSGLLLWGKMNLVFACLFVVLILWNEFKFKRTANV